jgi:hypothetical protein
MKEFFEILRFFKLFHKNNKKGQFQIGNCPHFVYEISKVNYRIWSASSGEY